jgi:hypothetical protein
MQWLPSIATHARSLDSFDRGFLWMVAAYVVGLLVLGAVLHPIPAVLAENDGYVGMAQQIQRGELPRDPFRPMLYPLLSAALGWIVGDCFTAAKIVSSVAAGLFVLTGGLLVRRCFGDRVAAWSALLTALNAHVILNGIQASTDMLASALSMLALWFAIRTASDPRLLNLIGLGAACAMAYFTRYQTSLLMVPALLGTWVAPAAGVRTRIFRSLLVGTTVAVFLVPHFLLTHRSFGSILHDESWRNVALKHYGNMDFSRLEELPFDGMWSVLRYDPSGFVQRGFAGVTWFARWTGSELLRGGSPVARDTRDYTIVAPALDASSSDGQIGIVLGVLVVVGVVTALWRAPSPFWIVFAYSALYIIFVCVAFAPWPRLLLVTLPPLYAAIVMPIALVRGSKGEGLRCWIGGSAVLALIAGVVSQTPDSVSKFMDAHPFAEVAAARELSNSNARPPRVVSTYSSMGEVVPGDFRFIHPPYAQSAAASYLNRAVVEAVEQRAVFLLVGRVTMGVDRFEAIGEAMPAGTILIRRDGDVLLLRVLGVRKD